MITRQVRHGVAIALLVLSRERHRPVAAAGDSCAHRVDVAEHHGDAVCAGSRRSRRRRVHLLPLSRGRRGSAEGRHVPEARCGDDCAAEARPGLRPQGSEQRACATRNAGDQDRSRRSRVVARVFRDHSGDQRGRQCRRAGRASRRRAQCRTRSRQGLGRRADTAKDSDHRRPPHRAR